MADTLEARAQQIAEEFSELEPRERLELLLEFANSLPPLPEKYEAERLAGHHRVHECQTPTYLWVEIAGGRTDVYGWVAPEAPTVKGFVGVVRELLNGLPPEESSQVSTNLVHRLGLVEALGMMRMRGMSAVLFYLQKQIRALMEEQAQSPGSM